MTKPSYKIVLLLCCAVVCMVQSGRQSRRADEGAAANLKLMEFYNKLERQGTYEQVSQRQVAEFAISRKFFTLEEQRWTPSKVPFGTDYGLAVSLRSVAPQMDGIIENLRKVVPEEGLYLPPNGHHVTVQHLCNMETITKKKLIGRYFNSKVLGEFLPSAAEVLRSLQPNNVTITFRKILIGPTDGSVMMVGTVVPSDVLPTVRQLLWDAYQPLGVPSLRDAPWEIVHTTVGRLLPSADSDEVQMHLTPTHYAALKNFIASYNALPPSQQISITVDLSHAISFMHNKKLFSLETFHDVPLRELHSTSPQLASLLAAFRQQDAMV
eukprot:TRINITY_DN28092_c0_g1_i1.p1 TRINITY_DN28092_c0_g1~~TRINITY_DN28092_c0_g1_i1.p1  ORF type:complete len:324 (+),score=60.19 TRINITY_DN28092_c0_g1_i1:36-1007(+)